jgi:hypothetical protein
MPHNWIKNQGLQKKPNLDFRKRTNKKPNPNDLRVRKPVFTPHRPIKLNRKMALFFATLILLGSLIEATAKKAEKPKRGKLAKGAQGSQKTHKVLNPAVRNPNSSCPSKVDFPSKHFIKTSSCSLEEAIYGNHHVLKNVASIRDAKVIVLTENHLDLNHHRYNKKIRNHSV